MSMAKQDNYKFLSTPSARRATALRKGADNAGKFLSTPSARRATGMTGEYTVEEMQFLSTPSARRATAFSVAPALVRMISIHALREEGDDFKMVAHISNEDFYPRPPRGGRRRRCPMSIVNSIISIHALREEGDRLHRRGLLRLLHFYPRPPRGGRPPSAASRGS